MNQRTAELLAYAIKATSLTIIMMAIFGNPFVKATIVKVSNVDKTKGEEV